ncbi:DUF3108 domain-containing protein [Chitinimonas koreensis]|uniref:DUF3108 domain-containing protein n=1 Tax=Chitinimonas koreensis TaxID=356302 RepID=UPI000428B429|nr:DUF3108 domain-containing protein [Chitinimonas koreensis]
MIRPTLALFALAAASLAPLAEPLPARATITYEARLGGMPVGEAVQRWTLAQGQYKLDTEIKPILGPRIRYQSSGAVGNGGLKPADYAEYRGGDTPRNQVRFDWTARQVSYGAPDALKNAKLDDGAQDLNALPFQLAWLGDKSPARVQVVTGRKVRDDRFALAAPASVSLKGKTVAARVWRVPEGGDATEFWLAPELGNLPVKIVRRDDHGELQLVAKQLDYQTD